MDEITYTIYDADPSGPDAVAWPTHTDVVVDVDPHDDICTAIVELLEELCATLRPEGGYSAGQSLWALIRMPDGSAETVSVEIPDVGGWIHTDREVVTVRVFRGSETQQLDVSGSPAQPQSWYCEPSDYEGDVLWSEAYASEEEARAASLAASEEEAE